MDDRQIALREYGRMFRLAVVLMLVAAIGGILIAGKVGFAIGVLLVVAFDRMPARARRRRDLKARVRRAA